jgi:hypothetical protein
LKHVKAIKSLSINMSNQKLVCSEPNSSSIKMMLLPLKRLTMNQLKSRSGSSSLKSFMTGQVQNTPQLIDALEDHAKEIQLLFNSKLKVDLNQMIFKLINYFNSMSSYHANVTMTIKLILHQQSGNQKSQFVLVH